MNYFLGIALLAFCVGFLVIVPCIGLFYKLRFIRGEKTRRTAENDTKELKAIKDLHQGKKGTPTGGGIPMFLTIIVLFALSVGWVATNIRGLLSGYSFWWEVGIIFSTFILFGVLGFYDDVIKIFGYEKSGFFGLRMRQKLLIQIALAAVVAGLMYWGLKIDFVYVPFWGIVRMGIGYFFLATFLIVAFANAFDITD